MSIAAIAPSVIATPADPLLGAGVATATAVKAPPATAPVQTAPPTAQDVQAAAIGVATTQAAVRQAALAPLLADLAQALTIPSVPAPVQAALTQVLAAQTPIDPPPTAENLQQAASASGLFLEARLAADAAPPVADLKAALLVAQQVLQTWVDSATAETATPATSPPAQTAATEPVQPQTVAAFAPSAPTPTPLSATSQPVVTAIEAALANPIDPASAPPSGSSGGPGADNPGDNPPPHAPPPPVAGDTSAPAQPSPPTPAAVQSGAASPAAPAPTLPATSTADAPPPPIPTAAAASQTPVTPPAPPPPAIAIASSLTTLNLLLDVEPAQAETPAAAPLALPQAPAPSAPAPPYRNGPTTAQPPAAPSLTADTEPALAARRLLAATGGALARQQLHQIASLPSPASSQQAAVPEARWMFELPFATPRGAAVAQFEISRDGGGGASADSQPTWRARFSIDLEPMGPVHAQVALTGSRAGVTLWAERPATAEKLRAGQAALSQGLEQAEFAPAVSVHVGAPRPVHAPAGRFLDQAS